MRKTKPRNLVTRSVVKVGDGRGFIIEHRVELPPFKGKRYFRDYRIVVTAAHCLPHLPPCHPASHDYERTYKNLLGPLASSKPNVWAECLFADPVADIAVLCCPDEQELYEEAESYEALTDAVYPLRIGEAHQQGRAWVLGLDRKWISFAFKTYLGGSLWLDGSSKLIKGGMSGSPIIADNGTAIGVLSVSTISSTPTKHGPNPRLMRDLPMRFLSRIKTSQRWRKQ